MMRPQRRLNEEEAIDDVCVSPAVLVVEEDDNAMDPLLWVIDESHSELLSVSSVNYVPLELLICFHRLRNVRLSEHIPDIIQQGSAIL